MAQERKETPEIKEADIPKTSKVALDVKEKDVENARVHRMPSFQKPLYVKPNTATIACEYVFLIVSLLGIILSFPISLCFIFTIVNQFQRVVIMRNGRVYKNRHYGPGLVCYVPCIDILKTVDLRTAFYSVPPQEALTRDSLTVSVDAVVYYKVYDPVSAIINIADFQEAVHLLAATTLRNALGSLRLTEMLTDRPGMNKMILDLMKKMTSQWGVKVMRVEISDIRLPLELQKIMATEAESSRLANAKIIVAKAEIEATKSLQKAMLLLTENPMCMQLRYLQSLHNISGDKAHIIVFPFSPDTLRKIFNK